jgi:hypothetical protein
MITVTQCDVYFADCQKLGADPAISMERARAIMAICHAWIQMTQRVKQYDIIVRGEDGSQSLR